MNDVGPLGPHDREQLKNIAHGEQRAEATALIFPGNDGNPLGLKPLTILTHPSRNNDLIPTILRRLRHRQEMGEKKPVFSDEIEYLGHERPVQDKSFN